MNYETLQSDLTTRLGQLNSNPAAPVVDIVGLPEVEADYKRSINPDKPRITVAYTGSEYGKGNSDFNSFTIDHTSQEETVNVQVEIHGKKLYGPTGLYAILQASMLLLVGYKPTNCDKLHFKRSQLEKTEDGLWYFVTQYIVKTYAIEPNGVLPAVLLSQINYINSSPL